MHKVSLSNMFIYFRAKCFSKIGMITLNNAFNNSTMVHKLGKLLQELNIPFDAGGNCIQ